jgi:hypothetical protein
VSFNKSLVGSRLVSTMTKTRSVSFNKCPYRMALIPLRELSYIACSMLNCFFDFSTHLTENTVYRNNENRVLHFWLPWPLMVTHSTTNLYHMMQIIISIHSTAISIMNYRLLITSGVDKRNNLICTGKKK